MYNLIHACCLDQLPRMEDNSVHAIVTDPPYELGIVNMDWDSAGVAYAPGVWIECLRVLRPGGHLLAFGGTRTYHRLVLAIEDAGFEIRDCVSWMFATGFPKSHNVGKATESEEWEGWGTALKPAQELIVLARKPLSEKTVAANVLLWGTGAINIDATRVPGEPVTSNPLYDVDGTPKDNNVTAESEDGVMGLNRGKNPPSSKGRWPANVVHDGSEEATAGMPVSKSGKAVYGEDFVQPSGIGTGGSANPNNKKDWNRGYDDPPGSASRYFYCAKASRSEREAGLEDMAKKHVAASGGAQNALKKRSGKYQQASEGTHGRYDEDEHIGLNRPKLRANSHPTVKPIALMRWLVRMVTPPNGTVLDPFMGSGTTGIAAHQEGFHFIGIEQSEEYHLIAQQRLLHWSRQETLLEE